MEPAGIQLTWDTAFFDTVEKSQHWILRSMRSHGPALVSLLWKILGNEQDVCDAYQELFLKLAHRPDRDKPANLRAYLFRTASNIAVTHLRRRMLQEKHLDKVRHTAERAAPSSPAEELDARAMKDRLRAAISNLPDYLREVVVLRDLAELPYTEVARMLNIPGSTARVYRYKAVQLLAEWLK